MRFLLALLLVSPAWATTITHGPILRAPSASGFAAWVKGDGAGTVALETSPAGAGTWTAQDSDSLDSTLSYTAVLTATSLSAGTKYDYRLKLDGAVVGSYWTRTMPPSTGGNFRVCNLMDTHGENAAAFAMTLAYYRSNVEPLGIPAVATVTGDFVNTYPTEANPSQPLSFFEDIGYAEIAEMGDLPHYIPLLFQFDDHDWGGNNSSSTRAPIDGSMANVATLYEEMWRQPTAYPAAPSYAYEDVIAGVPLIFTDGRSQRTQVGLSPYQDGHVGTETESPSYTFLGAAQRTWLVSKLATYRTKGLVLFYGGGTWHDNVSNPGTPGSSIGQRDSTGIWWKHERNTVLSGMDAGGFPAGVRLVLVTGDDHRNTVWGAHDHKATPHAWDGTPGGADLGLSTVEIKVASGPTNQSPVGGTLTWFGNGDLFEQNGSSPARESVLVFDVTSSSSGATASMRATYLWVSGGMIPYLDGSSRAGDFGLSGGTFAAWGN